MTYGLQGRREKNNQRTRTSNRPHSTDDLTRGKKTTMFTLETPIVTLELVTLETLAMLETPLVMLRDILGYELPLVTLRYP